MRRRIFAALMMFGLLAPWQVLALDPGEELPVAAQEEKARALFRELRCMVCQNQAIDDSDAPLAKDLRMLVRERVAQGDSADEIRTFLVARYGNFVLLRPPVTAGTIVLWAAPAVVLIVGGLGIFLASRRRRAGPGMPAPLSEAERARLEAITRAGEG